MKPARKTKAVKTILNHFEQSHLAISVVDLVEGLQDEMNKTTVYRILERLEADGTLHSFLGKDGRKWYAKGHKCQNGNKLGTHPHFQCMICGKVECLSFEFSIPPLPHYKIENAELFLVGRCKDCLS